MSDVKIPPKEAAVQALLDNARANERLAGALAQLHDDNREMLEELRAIRECLEESSDEERAAAAPSSSTASTSAPSSPAPAAASPSSSLGGLNLGPLEGLVTAELAKRGVDTSKPGFDPMTALSALLAQQAPTNKPT